MTIEALILVPDPAGGYLALAPEERDRARQRAAEVLGASRPDPGLAAKDGTPMGPETLVDAAGMAALTHTPPSWWAAAALREEVPHYRFGRWVRFRPSEALRSDAFVKHIGKEHPRAVEQLPPSRHEMRLMKGKKV